MSLIELRSRDFALLGRLNRSPREIGELPGDSVERLTSHGLVRQVLGYCEITRAGQLTFHRQQFLKVPRGRTARASWRTPLGLREIRLYALANRVRLLDFLKARRNPARLKRTPR